MDNFDRAIEVVLQHEGGYVNNPKDPGGETNYGISKKSNPTVDIKNLTRENAKTIYKARYWEPNLLHRLNDPEVATAALDTVVQHGSKGGGRILQQAVTGAGVPTTTDGKLGAGSIAAMNTADPKKLLANIYMQRKMAYERDPNAATFLPGWMKRISRWSGGAAVAGGGFALLLLTAAGIFFYMKMRKR